MPRQLSIVLAATFVLVAAVAGPTSARAAAVFWAISDIDGGIGLKDRAVSTNGTLIEAANFGPAGVPALTTVNTVPFTGVNFAGGGSPTNLTGLTYDTGQSGLGTSTGGSIDTLRARTRITTANEPSFRYRET